MKSEYTGIRRILKAFSYSKDGFSAAFKSEVAFRQDILFCLIMGIFLLFLPVRGVELAFLIFSLVLILLMELVNSAIEAVVDRVGEDFHPLSKKAKDIGSLLVLIAFIHWALSWSIILIPKLFG